MAGTGERGGTGQAASKTELIGSSMSVGTGFEGGERGAFSMDFGFGAAEGNAGFDGISIGNEGGGAFAAGGICRGGTIPSVFAVGELRYEIVDSMNN